MLDDLVSLLTGEFKAVQQKKRIAYSTPRYSVSRAKVFTKRAIKHREYMRKRRNEQG